MTAREFAVAFMRRNGGRATHAEILAAGRIGIQQLDYALLGLMKDDVIEVALGIYQFPDRRPPQPINWHSDRAPRPPRTERFCTRCETQKAIAEFYKTDTRCKPCRKELAKAAYKSKRGSKNIVTTDCHDGLPA